MVHLGQYVFVCGALSCGSFRKHGSIYGHLFKRSPLGCRKRVLGTGRLPRNKKPALCVLHKKASVQAHLKCRIFWFDGFNAVMPQANSSYGFSLHLGGSFSILHCCRASVPYLRKFLV